MVGRGSISRKTIPSNTINIGIPFMLWVSIIIYIYYEEKIFSAAPVPTTIRRLNRVTVHKLTVLNSQIYGFHCFIYINYPYFKIWVTFLPSK